MNFSRVIYLEILYFHFNFLFKTSLFGLYPNMNSISKHIKILKNGELNIFLS